VHGLPMPLWQGALREEYGSGYVANLPSVLGDMQVRSVGTDWYALVRSGTLWHIALRM